MANVLTNLAADIFTAADVVGRELVGFIPASTINANGSERVAKGDTVRASFTRAATAVDVTEAMTIPEGTDQTVDNKTLSITKSRAVQIPYTGEDVRHLNNGIGFETVYGDQIAQAMRTLCNEVEADLAVEAYQNASRAHGTAGTTPFGSNNHAIAEMRRILVDNGMPTEQDQVSLILSSAAGANLRKLASLQQVNNAGNDTLLRQGILLDLMGMGIRESAQVQSHTQGTATGLDANGGEPVGETSIVLDGGDGGTLLSGDIVTFAGDTDKYVVNSGFTAAAGTAVIGSPGLRSALASTAEMTVGASYVGNIALHRKALELAIRPPAVPSGGDAADDSMIVQDQRSGLVFEIRANIG